MGATDEITALKARVDELYADNQRLRWRHETVIPDWNDLHQDLRTRLCELGECYAGGTHGGQMMHDLYNEIRQALRHKDQR